jgi:hypothetical protein
VHQRRGAEVHRAAAGGVERRGDRADLGRKTDVPMLVL